MEERASIAESTAAEAEYAIESPLQCPQCHQAIASLQVVRLLRNRVNFTSTLPRKGYVMICPSCQGVLAASLGGI